MNSNDKTPIICSKCNVELEMIETVLYYLEHTFKNALPRCPKCGQVYISEDLVKGKVSEVEMTLEDK
jgi:uncharacterized Zn finger protein